MPERWVVNASPLIVLCKINHQHLFSHLATDIVVPQAVVWASPRNVRKYTLRALSLEAEQLSRDT